MILESTCPSLLYMHCFFPIRFIDVNIINVTAFATSSCTWLPKNFYAESITSSLTHYYFPSRFIDKLDKAPNDK
jgi:hypothetical protein